MVKIRNTSIAWLLFLGLISLGLWLGRISAISFDGAVGPLIDDNIRENLFLFILIHTVLILCILIIAVISFRGLELLTRPIFTIKIYGFLARSLLIGFSFGFASWNILKILILIFVIAVQKQ